MSKNSSSEELQDLSKGVRFSPWYLNTRRIEAMTGYDIGAQAQRSITENSAVRAEQMHLAMRISQGMLFARDIPNLTEQLLRNGREEQRVFAATWANFTFSGLIAAVRAEQRHKAPSEAKLSGEILVGEKVFKAGGCLLTEHVYSSSCIGYLSGRKRAYIVGFFDFSRQADTVEISPVMIGEFTSEFAAPLLKYRWPDRSRIYPSEILAFSKMEKLRAPAQNQIQHLQDFSEEKTKHAFAEILGEPFVPKDWAGEKSDLYSGRVSVAGNDVSAAFLFKGPSIFRPMHPADLGKRGDQLVRLFDEPADILVLQHCHKVETSVIKQMEALAVHPSRPRMYCIIDGADTYRILKAYGHLAP